MISDFKILARVVHKSIFPNAKFVRIPPRYHLIILANLNDKPIGGFSTAAKNLKYIFPKAHITFKSANDLEIETMMHVDKDWEKISHLW